VDWSEGMYNHGITSRNACELLNGLFGFGSHLVPLRRSATSEGYTGFLGHWGFELYTPKTGAPAPRIHSRYADGTPVFRGQQPTRIRGPALAAEGSQHTVLRWDRVNGRIYQAREFGPGNIPIRDIDMTNPTFPDGRFRPSHPGPPHQHRWFPNNPSNPRAGFYRGDPEPMSVSFISTSSVASTGTGP
jgi:hypothetical protein